MFEERLGKVESSLDQQRVKLDHELPKQVTKIAGKVGAKTEKKLFTLLKEQS